MTAATLGDTARRLASRGIAVRLAVELTILGDSVSGPVVPCPWCGRAGALAVMLELAPATDDDAAVVPIGGPEVEQVLCVRCTERYVPDALAGLGRVAGHDLTVPLQEALREGLAPLLKRLGATDRLAAAAVFTVIPAPPVVATARVPG